MGNTVGSLELPSVLRARKRVVLPLTERQKEILVGCVLGDAHIRPLGKIRIEHSHKQQDYIDWKYRELKSVAYPALPRVISRRHRKTRKHYQSVFFELRQFFREWHTIFYQNHKKVFPPGLPLTPLSLAVWYMDDGHWSGNRCLIAIEGFSDESRKEIQRQLLKQFDISSLIRNNGKLLVRAESHQKFFGVISPHVIPGMAYKLP